MMADPIILYVAINLIVFGVGVAIGVSFGIFWSLHKARKLAHEILYDKYRINIDDE